MRALLILLVVVAIGVVAGDRIALVIARDEIGKKIAAQYDLPQCPKVDIDGFPFLTQAIAGKYRRIDVAVGDWSGQRITVHDLDVRLSDVTAPVADAIHDRTSGFVADTATATALVPYDTVRRFAPREVESISNAPDGLHVTGTFSVAGIPVPATVVVTVEPTDDGISVTPVSVRAVGGGPTAPLEFLRRYLTFTVPLQRLPLGARISGIEPGPNGLDVTAVVHDIHFSDLPSTTG